jgi:glycosyltransferase involved in cell wall biosynthesis
MVNKKYQNKSLLPFVSFVIPTYNAEKTLKKCLESIFVQDYPKEKFEVLVIDGGSSDRTLDIARAYLVKIFFNERRYEDGKYGGKAIGINAAKGDLVALVDSDNFLSSSVWLKNMVLPFIEDFEVSVCETPRYANKMDPAINRYCSCLVTHTSRGDPFTLTYFQDEFPKTDEDFVVYTAKKTNLPSIGNGAIARRDIIQKLGGFDYDIDLVLRMIDSGYNKFARVTKVGIYHLYVQNFQEFIKKGIKRVRLFLYRASHRQRALDFYLPRDKATRLRFLHRVLAGLTLISPMTYAAKKFKKERDRAWLYHPVICFVVPIIYLVIFLTNRKGRSLFIKSFL